MIEAAAGWVKNIVFVVIFAAFLELVLPNNNLQRFVKVIMGLFIMLAVLNPVVDLLTKPDRELMPVFTVNEEQMARMNDRLTAGGKERTKLTAEIYQEGLAKQIKAVVLAVEGVDSARVQVKLTEQPSPAAGQISQVTVYYKPVDPAGPGAVGKIAINRDGKPDRPDSNESLAAKIRRSVAELYQIPARNIEVKPM